MYVSDISIAIDSYSSPSITRVPHQCLGPFLSQCAWICVVTAYTIITLHLDH